MQFTVVLATLLPMLAAASPLSTRAGGPAYVPIPANCTVMNTLPHAGCGVRNVNGVMASTSFTAKQIYSYYADNDSTNMTSFLDGCLQQCNGYGTRGSCRSVLVAQNVPTPKGYYGTPGGTLSAACLMYSDFSTPLNFTTAPSGQYMNATAGTIFCPGYY